MVDLITWEGELLQLFSDSTSAKVLSDCYYIFQKVSRRKFPFQFSWLNKIKDFSAFLFSSKMILFVTLFDVTAHLD